eukprot:m.227229 g.227229  ORF g.227229 m.227229 type:complete len:164 (-) comp11557_c0_seq1:172-663(-)
MPGLNPTLFDGPLPAEFECSICLGVLHEPVFLPTCEHVFCATCIATWLRHDLSCPVDRQPAAAGQARPIPRFFRNLLGSLRMRCEHECGAAFPLGDLPAHDSCCPKKPVFCPRCGQTLLRAEIDAHLATHPAVPPPPPMPPWCRGHIPPAPPLPPWTRRAVLA